MSATNMMFSRASFHNTLSYDLKDIRVWGGDDAFTHLIVVGPTRCGKTSTILEPMAYQMLLEKKRGKKVGFSVIEPKGDLVQKIYDMAVAMGLEDEVVFLDPTNPNSHRLNVMQGKEDVVVEATVAVLKSLFGKQEAFFSSVQESSTRNVVAMLKRLYGDNLDIETVLENLRDLSVLTATLNSYKQNVNQNDDVVKFVEGELLGTGKVAEQYRSLVIGLRVQLTNLISNPNLKRVITGKSDVDIDKHLEEGKILLVNTAAGLLGRSGDAFGMFVSMHLQLATFRRPGNEKTRIPHYLIIDEYSQYINPYVARFLSFAASYRVALVAAIQSFSQLEVASGDQDAKTIRNAIINTARNKIIFGGVEIDDAKFASEMMADEDIESRTKSYDGGLIPAIIPSGYRVDSKERAKFTTRFFMDGMPRFHCVCKLVEGGVQTASFLAKGEWIPSNWKELAEQEVQAEILSEEEQLEQLIKNRPSIFKWKRRAYFDVEIYKLLERKKKREQLERISVFEEQENVQLLENNVDKLFVSNDSMNFSNDSSEIKEKTQMETTDNFNDFVFTTVAEPISNIVPNENEIVESRSVINEPTQDWVPTSKVVINEPFAKEEVFSNGHLENNTQQKANNIDEDDFFNF